MENTDDPNNKAGNLRRQKKSSDCATVGVSTAFTDQYTEVSETTNAESLTHPFIRDPP